MLDELKQEYNFSEQDAMLVLKDILYNVWKNRKNKWIASEEQIKE